MERVEPEETPESYVERVSVGLWKTGFVEQYPDEGKQVPLGGDLHGLIDETVIVGVFGERMRQMRLVCIKEGVDYT